MEAWEVLERAADVIERGGWQQGDGTACLIERGSCAATAINKAAIAMLPTATLSETIDVIRDAVTPLRAALGASSERGIWQWNDAPGRTKEEVIAMLRAVAASLRAAARTAGTRQPVAASTDAGVDAGNAALMERVS